MQAFTHGFKHTIPNHKPLTRKEMAEGKRLTLGERGRQIEVMAAESAFIAVQRLRRKLPPGRTA